MKFEGLYDIDWDSLEHAYGPAGDVPDLIYDLVSVSDETKKKALWSLFGNIHHQGTVYPASVPAVPFLVEATNYIAPKHLPELLDLLLCLAQGHGYYDVHQHSALMEKIIDDMPDAQGVISGERNIVAQTTLAVFNHWEVFEKLMEDDALAVRLKAAEILTFLANCARSDPAGSDSPLAYLGVSPGGHDKDYWHAKLVKRIEACLKPKMPELEKAMLINTLGDLDQQGHNIFGSAAYDTLRPFERYVAVAKLSDYHLRSQAALPSDIAQKLAGLMDDFAHIEAQYSSKDWIWDGRAEFHLFALFARMADTDIERHSRKIVTLIEKSHNLFSGVPHLLYLALGRPPPDIPNAPCQISEGRKAIARAFVLRSSETQDIGIWHPANGNASSDFDRFGVTRDRQSWMTWLDISETAKPGPHKKQGWWASLFGRNTHKKD